MNRDIYVYAEYQKGQLAEVTFEMLGKGRQLADLAGGRLFAMLAGKGVSSLAMQMAAADGVVYLEDERLANFTPEAYQIALAELIRERQPWLILFGSTSIGLDLAAYLSAELGIPFIAYCKDLCLEDGVPLATSRLFGGKMFVEIAIEHEQAVLSVLPGAFPVEPGLTTTTPQVEQLKPTALDQELRTHFVRFIEPEKTDVDITAVPILVSLGRGIEAKENVALAQELADELGGALAASRPVVDQGWLPMSRQVGRSGVIVKPRLYLALGISGAPEHTEGMRGAELIIAINKDPQAPIFEIAHYGVHGNVLDLVPALTDAIKCRKLAA